MTESKKNTRFFGLWTIISDDQSVIRALRATQYVAFFVTFSYSLQALQLLLLGETYFSSPPEGSSQFYIDLGLALSIALLFLWLGIRIRKGKFGAVPYVCALLFFEIIFNLLDTPWRGLLGTVIFGVLAVCGMKAWFLRRKYGLVTEKRKKNWFLLGACAVFGVFLVAMMGVGLLVETGVFPQTQVVSGDKLPDSQVQALIDHAILGKSDTIEYFYSEGFYSVVIGGQFLTAEKLVVYEELNGALSVYEMPYAEIESVELLSQGDFLEDSLYLVNGKPNSHWESIMMYLSVENGGDQVFIDRLQQHIGGQ